MLADVVIASRNGRNVLPVKNTYRNRIAGVVHDISASGNTVYIEPRAVVNLNEEIANHRADERYEIIQILEELKKEEYTEEWGFLINYAHKLLQLLTTLGLSVT